MPFPSFSTWEPLTMVGEHNAYAFPRPQTTTFSTGLRGRTGQQSQCLRALGLGSRGEAAPQHPVHLELLHRSTKRTLTSGGWEGLGGGWVCISRASLLYLPAVCLFFSKSHTAGSTHLGHTASRGAFYIATPTPLVSSHSVSSSRKSSLTFLPLGALPL